VERADVFVIGGGGTGSDVTYALAGSGLDVVMAEREVLGGECSHYGCDPTKAMLKAARVASTARRAGEYGIRVPSVGVDFPAVMDRVRRLIEEENRDGLRPYQDRGARVLMQEARLTGEHRVELADGTVFEADRIVLATGSAPTAPPIPGLEAGGFWTNREAIWHGGPVPESLAILGAGAIGVEFAQIYARFGSWVTLVEALPHVLPLEEPESAAAISGCLSAEGVEVRAGAKVTGVERPGGRWRLVLDGTEPVEAEALLVATGRRPVLDVHDLEAAGVELDLWGRPLLDDTLRTTAPHVWAGGDAKGDLLFTHVGAYDAEVIVADILGRPFRKDYRVVPRVTYCEPEVASVGLTVQQAREAGNDVVTSVAGFSEITRSFLEGEQGGQVKLVADATSGQLLGGHIVGENAGELVHELVAVMAGRVPAAALAGAIHAYPTLSETVRSAFRGLVARAD